MEKIVIEYGNYWTCENHDLLAPIEEEGIEFLFNDGSRFYLKDGEHIDFEMRKATDAEYKDYYHKEGFLFKGDKVKIIKGKKIPIGTEKEIKDFHRYNVQGTYGHQYTDYVDFTDGTKTNIQNVRIPGLENIDYVFEYKRLNVGGRL